MSSYDEIGIGYNKTRKADPHIAEIIFDLFNPQPGQLFLDIGCGTGNYTNYLQHLGLELIGIDPSKEMLNKAIPTNPKIRWLQGTAEHTGLSTQSVDGILATLTIHHWNDLNSAFQELSRVMKNNARLVIFTSTPEQMNGYWLNLYQKQGVIIGLQCIIYTENALL